MLQFYPRIPSCPAQPWYKFQFWTPPRQTCHLYTLVLALPVGHRASQLSPKSWVKYWCVQSERSRPGIHVAAANGLVWEKQETNSSRQNPTHFTVHTHPYKNTPQKKIFALKAVISVVNCSGQTHFSNLFLAPLKVLPAHAYYSQTFYLNILVILSNAS